MSDPIVAARARAIKEALGPISPSYLALSDADVIRRAQNDPYLAKEEKDALKREFSDNPLTSFAKGFGRGVGGDLVAAGVDKVLGTNLQSYLNDDVLADNPVASIAGGLTGGILGMAVPGGILAKGGKLAKAGLAGAGAWNAASQGYGYQAQELAHGDRTEIDPASIALQGAVGAAGGAALPKILSTQRSIAQGGLGGGKQLAKYVATGAVPGAMEAGLESGAAALANDTLAPSARERSLGVGGAMVQGALIGSVLGGGLDAWDARRISRAAPGVTTPPPPPSPSPPPDSRVGGNVAPTLQGLPYDPTRLGNVTTRLANEFIQSPAYQEGVIAGVASASREEIERSYRTILEQLAEGKTPYKVVDRATGRVSPMVYLKAEKRFLVMNPETGGVEKVHPSVFAQGGHDRLFMMKNREIGYPGEHKRVPKAARAPVVRGGQAYLPISFSPDYSEVGVISANPRQVPKGVVSPVEILPLEGDLLQGNSPFDEALRQVLEQEEAARKAAQTGFNDDVVPVDPDAYRQWQASVKEGYQTVNRDVQRRRGVRQ